MYIPISIQQKVRIIANNKAVISFIADRSGNELAFGGIMEI